MSHMDFASYRVLLKALGDSASLKAADEQLRQVEAAGNAHGAVHKPVAALDEQPKAHEEQEHRYQHSFSSFCTKKFPV